MTAATKRKNHDLTDLKIKRKKLQQDVEMLTKDADQLAQQAEAQGKLDLLTKSNALRKSASEKIEMIESIQQKIHLKRSTLD